MAALADIIFDCHHPASLARFWQEVLDAYAIAPYDKRELARLAKIGVHDPEDDPTVLLESAGTAPRIWFQQVPESKTVKNRVHLDVRASDVAAEIERLCALGAHLAADQPATGVVAMLDPEDNEFCVVP